MENSKKRPKVEKMVEWDRSEQSWMSTKSGELVQKHYCLMTVISNTKTERKKEEKKKTCEIHTKNNDAASPNYR